jgi:hypothetical protein
LEENEFCLLAEAVVSVNCITREQADYAREIALSEPLPSHFDAAYRSEQWRKPNFGPRRLEIHSLVC